MLQLIRAHVSCGFCPFVGGSVPCAGAVLETNDNRRLFMVYGGATKDGLATDAVFAFDVADGTHTWVRYDLTHDSRPR